MVDCHECAQLLKEAMDAVQAHIQATTRISNAVIEGRTDDIVDLERAVEGCRETRLDAMKRYQDHLATHEEGSQATAASIIGA